MQGSRFTGRLTGTAEVAADLVRTDPKYQHIIDNLLGRIIVVEDLTEASAVARNLGYRNRIVTLDGQVINAGGSFTGGSTARSVGVFSRKQELDELRSKLTKLEQKRTEAEKELAARKAEVDNLSAQLAGAEGEGMNAATEHVRANLELERLTKAAAQYDETARSIEAEIAAQQAAVTRNETARTEAEKARTDAEAELAQYTAELAALGESTGSLTAEREKSPVSCPKSSCSAWRTRRTSACMRPRWRACGAVPARPMPAPASCRRRLRPPRQKSRPTR